MAVVFNPNYQFLLSSKMSLAQPSHSPFVSLPHYRSLGPRQFSVWHTYVPIPMTAGPESSLWGKQVDESGEIKRVKQTLAPQLKATCDLLAAAPEKTMLLKELRAELGRSEPITQRTCRQILSTLHSEGGFPVR
jgi:hypothetical protein